MNLALNNLQWLICQNTERNQNFYKINSLDIKWSQKFCYAINQNNQNQNSNQKIRSCINLTKEKKRTYHMYDSAVPADDREICR